MGIKDEELEGLSDEERAALEDDDGDSEILGKIAGDDEDNDDEDSADDVQDIGAGSGDAPAAAASSESGNAADDDSSDDGKGGSANDAGSSDRTAEFSPEFRAAVPEGLDDRLTALDVEKAGLVTKFQDGEIDMAGFMSESSRLDNERMQLVVARENAKFAENQNKSQREQRWDWEQERFFGVEKNATTYKDPVMVAALDSQVKILANDAANNRRPASWFLEEADRLVRARFNVAGEQKPNTPKTPNTPGNRQPDLSVVPKTLSNLPAADLSETDGGEFAYLEKLDGIALEAALRKLSPEQEQRYLGAA